MLRTSVTPPITRRRNLGPTSKQAFLSVAVSGPVHLSQRGIIILVTFLLSRVTDALSAVTVIIILAPAGTSREAAPTPCCHQSGEMQRIRRSSPSGIIAVGMTCRRPIGRIWS
jgi:hypothetical protein